eukprot:CAMPEP_0178406846 /NCGR_PEP_ID=MMETSP0689_2-20121128/19121_1 /TAXON_ID=160604 /ORGANISM="Amphidinium massartii, Strain CS-259" /LENGTH=101 /DNA_ID=CAMNT_0020027897 /DNA_START=563 /DNA_END=867 /DNA_ORIENTATION=-
MNKNMEGVNLFWPYAPHEQLLVKLVDGFLRVLMPLTKGEVPSHTAMREAAEPPPGAYPTEVAIQWLAEYHKAPPSLAQASPQLRLQHKDISLSPVYKLGGD